MNPLDTAIVKGFSESSMHAAFSVMTELWIDDSTFLAEANIEIPKSSVHSSADWRTAFVTALTMFLNANGYSAPTHIWYAFDGEPGAAAFSSYQALVSQSGSSAPANTDLHTDFGAVTFAWGRSSAGVYTLTASSAIFTAGKTIAFISPPNNPLANFKYAVTSSTVITFGSSVNSLLSLLGLGFTTTPTDALLSATGIEVRVYP